MTRYRIRPGGSSTPTLSLNEVWAVYEDRQGDLWVGTGIGLRRLDRAHGTFHRLPVLSNRCTFKSSMKIAVALFGSAAMVSCTKSHLTAANAMGGWAVLLRCRARNLHLHYRAGWAAPQQLLRHVS
ncbi:MAG: two-component regulator propeller domain-containing protein [Acidobacteriota bacterium]